MLGEGAVEDVLATELNDVAGFPPDYHDWDGSVGLFGAEGPDRGPFGDPFPEGAVWPNEVAADPVGGMGASGVWADSDRDAEGVVGAVGSGVRGVNQASYFFGDARFRVNCLERPGVDKERLFEWVLRAQQEGGAETVGAGLEWVNRQGVGVEKKVWSEAWRGRGVLDYWPADFDGDEDPFVWERGVGEGDVAGVLDVSPVLAALQPKAQQTQRDRAKSAKYQQGLKAEAARVAVLEELAGRGELTEEQATELAALQPKVAQQKQQNRAKSAKYAQRVNAAADRVAELEELAGRGELTEEQLRSWRSWRGRDRCLRSRRRSWRSSSRR